MVIACGRVDHSDDGSPTAADEKQLWRIAFHMLFDACDASRGGEDVIRRGEDISETFHFISVSCFVNFTTFSPTTRKSGVMSCDISTESIDAVVDETRSCCRAFTFVCAVMLWCLLHAEISTKWLMLLAHWR